MRHAAAATTAGAWIAGLAAVTVLFGNSAHSVLNVVNYTVAPAKPAAWWVSYWVPAFGALVIAALTVWRRSAPCAEHAPGATRLTAARAGWPLAIPLAVVACAGAGIPLTFLMLAAALAAWAWAVARLGHGLALPPPWRRAEPLAPGLLAAALVLSTVWHAREQIALWQHFTLGYADFGFFTTELEHCLPWKAVGPERFTDTRLGYHAIWLFYALAPFYAVLRSPTFLMLVGPLALNLAAIPFYQLARDRSGSRLAGLAVGLAWLALPSITRLPYANTYGFQSIYLAVPWLAAAFSFGLRGRWRGAHVCLAVALLCEETVCAVAVGWGMYLAVWGGRRRDGLCIVAAAAAYLLLCVLVVIPGFAGAGQYTRWGLFGEVTAHGLVERWFRPRVGFYLVALAAPLFPALVHGRRVLIAALPTLLLVAALQNADYLNIKYWHQSSVLPVLFLAATLGVTAAPQPVCRNRGTAGPHVGPLVGLLVGVLSFQQWMGISPCARSYALVAGTRLAEGSDPRHAAVDWVRAHFDPDQTAVLATERMAAHFLDYRRVEPLGDDPAARLASAPHVLVIDRSDRWDRVVASERIEAFLAAARQAGYTLAYQAGAVAILTRPAAQPENS